MHDEGSQHSQQMFHLQSLIQSLLVVEVGFAETDRAVGQIIRNLPEAMGTAVAGMERLLRWIIYDPS